MIIRASEGTVCYGSFSLCVIYKSLCPSSRDINRLMMMMMIIILLDP
jgi:hypothetical protein